MRSTATYVQLIASHYLCTAELTGGRNLQEELMEADLHAIVRKSSLPHRSISQYPLTLIRGNCIDPVWTTPVGRAFPGERHRCCAVDPPNLTAPASPRSRASSTRPSVDSRCVSGPWEVFCVPSARITPAGLSARCVCSPKSAAAVHPLCKCSPS